MLQQSTWSSTLPLEDLFATKIRCLTCRFLSDQCQLVGLDGAAAVDLVFDMATSTTCFRPVPDADSPSFVSVLVGPWPASGSGRCCSRQPRVRHGHLGDLIPTCFRQRFAWTILKGLFRGHESQNLICHLISIRARAMPGTGQIIQ